MYHFFVKPENIGEKEIRIVGEDVKHMKNVLRMKPGEVIRLCTGLDNKDYRCEIESLRDDEVIAKIMWIETEGTELDSRIWLFQSFPDVRSSGWRAARLKIKYGAGMPSPRAPPGSQSA